MHFCLSLNHVFTIQTTTLKFNNNGWITADVFSVGKLIFPYLKLFMHNTLTEKSIQRNQEKILR
jgi:hypothetical protein